ncbi:uncharacterized protein LY89DRAFT_689349, partial [Mollisia scopiformis]
MARLGSWKPRPLAHPSLDATEGEKERAHAHLFSEQLSSPTNKQLPVVFCSILIFTACCVWKRKAPENYQMGDHWMTPPIPRLMRISLPAVAVASWLLYGSSQTASGVKRSHMDRLMDAWTLSPKKRSFY